MGKEIERKFLVKGDGWRGNKAMHTCQGYLPSMSDCTVRVRLQEGKAFLTIKGNAKGISRSEYEYKIPTADAKEILDHLCLRPHIEKNRYEVKHARD